MAIADGQREVPIAAEVAAVFDSYDASIRDHLLELRALILATAGETPGVGAVTEALRWGQPAYLTKETGSGSTIRLATTPSDSEHDYAVFFICHTNLVEQFAALFGETFAYEGNRALLFDIGEAMPVNELRACVAMALTHHLR